MKRGRPPVRRARLRPSKPIVQRQERGEREGETEALPGEQVRRVVGDRFGERRPEKHDDPGDQKHKAHGLSRTRRLAPRSQARIDAAPDRADVRVLLFARDQGRCLLAGHLEPFGRHQGNLRAHSCFGPWTPHHLRKEKHGGAYDLANIVTLCAGANSHVEDFPAWALSVGLVVGRGVSHAEAAARRQAAGLDR